jgi:hypothetical protein
MIQYQEFPIGEGLDWVTRFPAGSLLFASAQTPETFGETVEGSPADNFLRGFYTYKSSAGTPKLVFYERIFKYTNFVPVPPFALYMWYVNVWQTDLLHPPTASNPLTMELVFGRKELGTWETVIDPVFGESKEFVFNGLPQPSFSECGQLNVGKDPGYIIHQDTHTLLSNIITDDVSNVRATVAFPYRIEFQWENKINTIEAVD